MSNTPSPTKPKPGNKLISYTKAASEHNLSQAQVDQRACSIIEVLENHGYQGYIVGGAIRDLLCGIQPKDFDIATDASPEQVHKLFKNSRIIGRRFKIVHIYHGREVFEVATFRKDHVQDKSDNNKQSSRVSNSGQLLRDNVYGSIEEDAQRRDFSVNALYYSPSNEKIYDFCNSLDDIKAKEIRLIGNPAQRYAEDPVRMLRALRFSNKLGFKIEPHTLAQISESAPLIRKISHARLFDESIKLFHNPKALGLCDDLDKQGILQLIYPSHYSSREHFPWAESMFELALQNTVARIQQNKPVTIAYLYAVLLWPVIKEQFSIEPGRSINFPQFAQASFQVMREQSQFTLIAKRHAFAIKDIWEFQVRLQTRKPNKILWLIQQKRFRAAFDFLQLREACGELKQQVKIGDQSVPIGEWWEVIQFAPEKQQTEMIQALSKNGSRNRRRKRQKSRQSKSRASQG